MIAFGAFGLDPARECLVRDGRPVALTPKAYALLRHFVAHPDRLLAKDDLLDAIWSEAAGSDAALKVCVAELRRALDDDPAAPRYVATVHRRGYRFVAPVREIADGPSATTGAAAAARGIVGRDDALTRLGEAWAAARQGKRQTVFVTGDPGIGKTTLVETFLASVDGVVLRARGQCVELTGAGEPFGPVLDAFGRLCRDPAHADVFAFLRRTAPSWAAVLPGIAEGAGPAFPSPRARLLLELVEATEQLTARQPLVLVLEDLHWSDYSTLDWLSVLARRPDAARLLVIATYRPLAVAAQGHALGRLKEDLCFRGVGREIPLAVLTEADVAAHLAARLAPAAVPHDLPAFVHARTDGNPLFMVHVVDLLRAGGVLAANGDRWTFARDDALGTGLAPESLRHAIVQTVATLPAAERELLETASVAGTAPAAAAIAAALDAPVDAVEDALLELVRRGVLIVARGADVWPDRTRTARFAFSHTTYQSVLAESLPAERRRPWQRRIGERLAAAWAADASDVAGELALHFEGAGDAARAVPYRRLAAERAFRRQAYREAIDHLERALAPGEDGGAAPIDARSAAPIDARSAAPMDARTELAIRIRLGPALMAAHGFAAPEVERCYARARVLCRSVGKTPELSAALRGLGVFHLTRADLEPARALAEQSLALAKRGGASRARVAQAHVAVGIARYYLGELEPAARQLEQARRLFARTRSTGATGSVQAPAVNGLAYLGLAAWFRGRPDTAVHWVTEARRVAARLAHPHSIVWAAHVTALLHHFRGEPAPAAAAAETAIRLATELEFRQWIAWGAFFHGWLATQEDDAVRRDAGIAAMRAGLADYRATGAELGRIYFLATLAEAEIRAGRTAEGRAVLDEADALVAAQAERHYTAELHRLRARVTTEPAAAEDALRRALRLASRQGAHALALRAATDLAVRLAATGRATAARGLLAPIYGRFREGLDTPDLAAARHVLDGLSPVARPQRVKAPRRRSASSRPGNRAARRSR